MVYRKSRVKAASRRCFERCPSPLLQPVCSRSPEANRSEITHPAGTGRPGEKSSVSIKHEPQRRWKRHYCAYFTDVIPRGRRAGARCAVFGVGGEQPRRPTAKASGLPRVARRPRAPRAPRVVADTVEFLRIPLGRVSPGRDKLPASGALDPRPSSRFYLTRKELSLITKESRLGDVQM